MIELKALHEYGEELEKRLRLQTFPLALKLIEKEEDIPEQARRPKRDFGYPLTVSQGFGISRRMGRHVAMLKEDMWCFEPVIGYGLAEPPQYFLEGHNRFPEDVETLQAGSNYARNFPRLEVGKYIGIMSGPLTRARFKPDLVMLYGNSAQLSLFLLGREYKDGRDITCRLCSHAACVYAVVPTIQHGECQVAIPCRGEHYMAVAQDDEMIFTVPIQKLEDLLVGLRSISKYGSRLPRDYSMQPKPELADSYMKIGKMIGMDTSKSGITYMTK